MSYEIAKGRTKFLFGMSNPNQLADWLTDNPNAIGMAFVGRSNVGKSSLINTLFGNKTARVSKTPGRTREINIFSFEILNKGKPMEGMPPLFLFDLPGYGFAEVSREISRKWEALMGAFFEHTSDYVSLVNLQDARHPNQSADQAFRDYIKQSNFETYLVFNKMDKLKKQKDRSVLNKLKPQLFEDYNRVKEIFFLSAESKAGVRELEVSLISNIFDKINEKA